MLARRAHTVGVPVLLCALLVSGCGDDSPQPPSNGVNPPPIAAFVVAPGSATTQTTLQFDASGCSDDHDPASALQVRWDWEDDATWDTPFSATKTAAHRYETAGAKTIRMEVTDTGDSMAATTQQVSVTAAETIALDFGDVPAGSYTMGDGTATCGASQHDVILTRGFRLGKYEVTNTEYAVLLQWAYDQSPRLIQVGASSVTDPASGGVDLLNLEAEGCEISFDEGQFLVDAGKGDHPVKEVTWYGAAAFCNWLSLYEERPQAYDPATWVCNGGDPYTAAGYRLPTDAEWEYVARYNDDRVYPWGDAGPSCDLANFSGCVEQTLPVGSFPAAPAALGLHDLAGNVWEWCNDWHECDLGTQPLTDPAGPDNGTTRVMRGGSCYTFESEYKRGACRRDFNPAYGTSGIGFRVARTANP